MTDLVYEKCVQAIDYFKNGNCETLADAASQFGVRVDLLSIMYGNEDLFSNGIFVSEELANSRLAICSPCEFMEERPQKVCSLCNCNISVLTAMTLKRCEKGKW